MRTMVRWVVRALAGALGGAVLLVGMGKLYGLTGIACKASICNPVIASTYGAVGGLLFALFFLPRGNPFAETPSE